MSRLEKMVSNDSEEVKRIFFQIVGGPEGVHYPDQAAREMARLLAGIEGRLKALEGKHEA